MHNFLMSIHHYNTILNTNFNTKSSITPGIPNIPTIAADNHVIAIPSPNILSTHKITEGLSKKCSVGQSYTEIGNLIANGINGTVNVKIKELKE